MSSLFYDHLLNTDRIEKTVAKMAKTNEEKTELWRIIDELIHHRVFGCILENLPGTHHKEFLDMFHKYPNDKKLMEYLKKKIKTDVGILIKEAVSLLVLDIIKDVELPKKKTKARR